MTWRARPSEAVCETLRWRRGERPVVAKSRHAVPSKTIFEARGWRCEGCQKAVMDGRKTECGQGTGWDGLRASEAVSKALLETLRSSIWCVSRCQKAVSEALLEPLRGVGRPDRQTKAKLVCYDAVLGKSCRCCRIGAARAVWAMAESCEGLLALRDLTSVLGCQKAVSEGHKNRVRPRHTVASGHRCCRRGAARKAWGITGGGAAGPYKHLKVPKSSFGRSKKRVRPRHTVASEAQARALGAAGEVLQEKSEALLEKALRDLTSIWRCQKAVSEGHKKRVRPRHTVASEAQARALGAAGGAARKVWGIAGGGAAGPYKHLKVPKSTFGRS